MKKIFIWFQHIVPQHLLSRLTGGLARAKRPAWLKNSLIKLFVRQFSVDMSEAAEPEPTAYESFNEFFTRPLKEGARPLANAGILCPADGAISQIGVIERDQLLQAKGRSYSTADLLGGDRLLAGHFQGGNFATIYLSPKDYHRVHMPMDGRLVSTHYVPGDLFSVNGTTAEGVENLFARNERLVCHFETEAGPMAMVLVGAMIVAGIGTVWGGEVQAHARDPVFEDFRDRPVELSKGQEMGRFMLGSTVILLFGQDSMAWDAHYQAGTPTRMGEGLGSLV